jgi:peptidoglycan/LPS O-acetylase OafA/YrhL
MKDEEQLLPSGKWSWSAIAIFLAACAAGPITTVWQQAAGGDERMAAAYTGLTVAAVVFLLGIPVAIVALLRERKRRLLCGICSVLYAIPLLGSVILFVVYLSNKR